MALTAFVNDENETHCYDVGMVGVIHKPLSNDALQEVLEKHYFLTS